MAVSGDVHYVQLPLIISQTLRSVNVPTTGEGIVSILLSSDDLAKLDLSNLELFSVDNIRFGKGKTASSTSGSRGSVNETDVHDLGRDGHQERQGTIDKHQPGISSLQPCYSDAMPNASHFSASEKLNAIEPRPANSDLQLLYGNAMATSEEQSDAVPAEDHDEDDADSFSFQTPLIVSPGLDLSSTGVSFPLFKSRAVVEAEKAVAEIPTQSLYTGLVSSRKKAMSMDELTLDFHSRNGTKELAESWEETNRKVQDDSEIHRSKPGSSRLRWRAGLPALEIKRAGLEETAQKAESLKRKHFERILSRTLSKVTEEARIDLKASPASKFLLQVMPWELTPSPGTPVKTPAAVPFQWEVAPGKPKPRELPSPHPLLQLPPKLRPVPPSRICDSALKNADDLASNSTLSPQSEGRSPAQKGDHPGRHRKNSHSWHVFYNLFSGARNSVQDANGETRNTEELQQSGSENLAEIQIQGRKISCPSSCANPSSSPAGCTSSNSALCSYPARSSSSLNLNPREEKPSIDYQLPSPYVATFTPLTSPYRDLGPVEDDSNSNNKGPKTGIGIRTLAKMFHVEKKLAHWASKQKSKRPATEFWAPTLATYFHRLECGKDVVSSSESLLKKEDDTARNGRACENGSLGKRLEAPPLHSKVGATMDARFTISEEQESFQEGAHFQHKAEMEPVYYSTISRRPLRERRQKQGNSMKKRWVFRKLRRSHRLLAAIYTAIKGALISKKSNRRNLLHYESLE